LNIYPALKTKALAFFGCNDDPKAIGEAVRKWDAFALEDAMNRAGLQATVVRSPKEFLAEEQGQYVERMPFIEIEKIADSAPEPFRNRPRTPLNGVRALGLGHMIAGSGFGRAFAYHGADVLNIWRPNDFEMDFNYYTANVGMRSSIMDIDRPDEMARFKALLRDADVFFANRRPGFIERMGLSTVELAVVRPGIVHVDISIRPKRAVGESHRVRSDRGRGLRRVGARGIGGKSETARDLCGERLHHFVDGQRRCHRGTQAQSDRGWKLPGPNLVGPPLTVASPNGCVRQTLRL
jgi:hypothetical protein